MLYQIELFHNLFNSKKDVYNNSVYHTEHCYNGTYCLYHIF